MTAVGVAIDRGLGTLLALSVLVAATPYAARAMGLVVEVPARLEVIDHVVPGTLAAVALAVGLLALRGRGPFGVALTVSVALLAGIWTTSTHVPLLAQAGQNLVTWPAALFHTVPGLLLLITAAVVLRSLVRRER